MAFAPREPIVRTFSGFEVVSDTHVMKFSRAGKYLGQWQPNMLDGEGDIFLPAGADDDFDLTPEQVAAASKMDE